MAGRVIRLSLLLVGLLDAAAACRPAIAPTPQQGVPRAVTILDTFYVRFHIDGVAYHAVPADGDYLLRAASGAYILQGPAYLRKEGEEVWQCHPRGYQLPQGARIMVSSSRAPVTVETLVYPCR
jgi:hypothetical protein